MTMAPITIEWITPRDARERQREILAEAGMGADELRRRAAECTLDDRLQSLAHEYSRVDFPFPDDVDADDSSAPLRWLMRQAS